MKNRWLIALSAVGIHICIGSVYAWSVLTKPIIQEMSLTLSQTQWTFSLAILFLGLSAATLGTYIEKYGPRKAGLFSTFFFASGMLGTALAISMKSLPLLYLFYGVIGGIGLGTGYIAPVSTLVKWFPEKRGFATGMAIMGFGFASLIAGPTMQYLIQQYSLVTTFLILGSIYFVVMLLSSLYLAPPPKKSTPIQTTNTKNIETKYTTNNNQINQVTAKEALKAWRFYALWWLLFINITCGIGLLSVASPMAQEIINLTPMAAASMVGIIGLINGAGRFVWAYISDYIGRPNTYIAFFMIQAVAFFLLSQTTDSTLFQLLIYLIISCYGGGFACIPAFLSDVFGTKELGAIHGRILTAWAAAGVVGPLLVSWIKGTTNNYTLILNIFAACFVLSLIIAIIAKVKTKRLNQGIRLE